VIVYIVHSELYRIIILPNNTIIIPSISLLPHPLFDAEKGLARQQGSRGFRDSPPSWLSGVETARSMFNKNYLLLFCIITFLIYNDSLNLILAYQSPSVYLLPTILTSSFTRIALVLNMPD
jgi:hypothetical protein